MDLINTIRPKTIDFIFKPFANRFYDEINLKKSPL